MDISYYNKYLKYKTKYFDLKNKNYKQQGGALDFKNFPCSIYHAFNMKFTDIITKIPELKTKGITHIQPPPIQKCRENIGPVLMKKKNMTIDKFIWWLVYQPISYEIGNIYGTKDEFKKLIDECKKNDIKLIIDIVINHIRAPLNFEYPIWNIMLLITEMDKLEYDTEYTFWDIYNKIINNNIKTGEYIKNINYDEERFTLLKRLIFEALYESDDITQDEYKLYQEKKGNPEILLQFIEQFINNKYDKIDELIIKAFYELKQIICDYLDITIDKFKIEYYDIITPPFYCSNNVLYGYNCWLAQALPQLNQKNKIVIYKIFNYLDELAQLGINGLRIDAASHIQPKILKLYADYFRKKTNNSCYIYSEVINPQGKNVKLTIQDFSKLTHITEYNLLHVLSNTFCFQCNLNQLLVLSLPSSDIGSVVFSTTHDLESIDGIISLSRFGNYSDMAQNESYKIILMLSYLLQRIYNVPLIFKTQLDNNFISDCCKFRYYLYVNGCNKENATIIDNIIFKCDKFINETLLGTFYMNISDSDKLIDNITVPGHGIYIKYHSLSQ